MLSGFICLSFAILLEAQFHELYYARFFISLAGHIGIGLIVIGILSILIETDHWVEYFKARLSEIVIDRKYLENLSQEKLIDLQTDILRAFYKDEGIGGKDGFLEYYQKNIQGFVVSPFRTNLVSDRRIEYLEEGKKDRVRSVEVLTWNCKANQGRIQENVGWDPNEGEVEKVEDTNLRLEHKDLPGGFKEYSYEDLKKIEETKTGGIIFSLKDYDHSDGLKIILTIATLAATNKFWAWRMAHPSRGISLTVRYPADLSINRELYGIGDDCYELNEKGKGYYKLSSQKWVLPKEGVVFELV